MHVLLEVLKNVHSIRVVLGPYKVQKEVKSTQKQPSCEKIVQLLYS